MVFIYGGAYQGKTDFAKKNYNLTDDDIFYFTGQTGFDVNKKCLNGYHALVLSQIKAGIDPLARLEENIGALKNKIIIADDISAGVVPIDAETRKWREAAGRCATLISTNADEVWRVFCGIGSKIK